MAYMCTICKNINCSIEKDLKEIRFYISMHAVITFPRDATLHLFLESGAMRMMQGDILLVEFDPEIGTTTAFFHDVAPDYLAVNNIDKIKEKTALLYKDYVLTNRQKRIEDHGVMIHAINPNAANTGIFFDFGSHTGSGKTMIRILPSPNQMFYYDIESSYDGKY
jgi:hypothetical protein